MPVPAAVRARVADRLDRYARHFLWALVPLFLVALIDLPTGWLSRDRRIDVAVLVSSAMGLWAVHTIRRLSRRVRDGTPWWPNWLLTVASVAVSLGASAGLGYLLLGSVGVIVLPSVTIVLTLVTVALGLWRRRQIRARG
jgi:hypothetical protein